MFQINVMLKNVFYVMKGIKENGEMYYYGFCYDILEDYVKIFNFW